MLCSSFGEWKLRACLVGELFLAKCKLKTLFPVSKVQVSTEFWELAPSKFGKLDFLKCHFLHFAIISELFYETLYVRKVLCNVLPSDRTKNQKNLFRIS